MICREENGYIVMVRQHDHGLLSGELAAAVREDALPSSKRREEVLWAIAHHDRGWLDLDDTPFWNDAAGAPYTFLDFPLVPKLAFYTKGLDEIEAHTPYGALMCSHHYDRLIQVSGESGLKLDEFMEQEQERRSRIRRRLEQGAPIGEDELYYDALLLQFCDDLSLYLVLNEPGSAKGKEHPWWREGFSGSGDFLFTGGRTITAEWRDAGTLMLDPFPFEEELTVRLPQRRVSKQHIERHGIAAAFGDCPAAEAVFTLAPLSQHD